MENISSAVLSSEPTQFKEELGRIEMDQLRERNRKLNEKSSKISLRLNESVVWIVMKSLNRLKTKLYRVKTRGIKYL